MRLSFATGMASSRDTALALAQKYHEPSSAARTFALAFAHAQSALRHLGITSEDALLYERLASRVLYADRSLRAGPERPRPERARPGRTVAARHLGGSSHPARARGGGGRPAARPGGAAGAGVLAAQGAAGRRRDPERARRRLSRRDAGAAHGTPRQRSVEGVEPPARRSLPAARGPHGGGRARPARGRGASRAERGSGRLVGPARARPRPLAGAEPPDLVPSRQPAPAAASDAGLELPPLALANGLGGFDDGGRDYVVRLDGRDGDSAAVGERDRQSRVRHCRHRRRVRLPPGPGTAARTV